MTTAIATAVTPAAPRERRIKTVLRWALTVVMVGGGVNHFLNPAPYVQMMPDVLPAPLALVYISGVAEILGGLGLIMPATRRLAAWGIVALLVAVFPANLNMAINNLPLGTKVLPTWALWGRLPLQLVLIAWAYWFTHERRRHVNADGARSGEARRGD